MKLYIILTLAALTMITCSCDTQPSISRNVPKENSLVLKKPSVVSPKKQIHHFERKELQQKIESKYGEQWDFCSCIIKNDSINKAFKNKLSPEQEDKVIDRWDFVDSKCKELTTFDNTTPEERALYLKKVKNCLRNKN
jgi:hypothetical protein